MDQPSSQPDRVTHARSVIPLSEKRTSEMAQRMADSPLGKELDSIKRELANATKEVAAIKSQIANVRGENGINVAWPVISADRNLKTPAGADDGGGGGADFVITIISNGAEADINIPGGSFV